MLVNGWSQRLAFLLAALLQAGFYLGLHLGALPGVAERTVGPWSLLLAGGVALSLLGFLRPPAWRTHWEGELKLFYCLLVTAGTALVGFNGGYGLVKLLAELVPLTAGWWQPLVWAGSLIGFGGGVFGWFRLVAEEVR